MNPEIIARIAHMALARKIGMSSSVQIDEIGVLIKALQKDHDNKGWKVVRAVEEIPTEVGHYAIYDGIQVRGCGVTYDMRRSVMNSSWYGRCDQPIYMWLPDLDGGAALWLEGKMRCAVCKAVIAISDEDDHYLEVHDRDLERERKRDCGCND